MKRLIALPFVVFCNLSTGRKLGLTVAGALVLLVAVSWFALNRLTMIGSLQDGMAAQSAAEQRIQATLLSALELRVISRNLEFQQKVSVVRDDAKRAAAQHAAARTALQEAETSASTAQDRARLAKAISALDAMAKAVQREAALRAHMLVARRQNLFGMWAMFQSALQNLEKQLEGGGAMKSGANEVEQTKVVQATANLSDPAQVALNGYRLAMARLQSSAMMFLATGTAAGEVGDAADDARQKMAVILNSSAPDSVKGNAKMVAAIGTGIAKAAETLIWQSKQLHAIEQNEVTTAAEHMQAALAAVDAAFAARVNAASKAALAGRHAAERQEIALIAGNALLMLILGMCVTRVIAGPIRRLTRTVAAIAGGDTTLHVHDTGRRDEIGQMAVAVEMLRKVMQKTFVQSQMIEQIPVGVMTAAADAACGINYVNPETVRLMELVREQLPVEPADLLGQSLGVLHPTLAGQLDVFQDAANLPRRLRITLAGETLDLQASAIRDGQGCYMGPMLIWRQQTGQVQQAQRFEGSVKSIADTVAQSSDAMRQTALALRESAADSSTRATAVDAAATQAADHIGVAATGAEELTASVTEISRQVAESARIASDGVYSAETADGCVVRLNEAASRIGAVVNLINEIASHTSLLALNATIEAARAGESGRGFAVVASEVKALATQTARATEEISTQIAGMQDATGQAVGALRSVSTVIGRMNEIATAIAGAVEQQRAATREIAVAVQQAALDARNVTSEIGLVSRCASNTGAQADDVLTAATRFAEQSAALDVRVQEFLSSIQQAA